MKLVGIFRSVISATLFVGLTFVGSLHFSEASSNECLHYDEELWLGTLDVGVAKLRLALYLSEGADGKWQGRVVSLDQQNAVIPCDTVEINDSNLIAKMPIALAQFEGNFNESRSELVGKWTQGGRANPLTFKKADKIPERELLEIWRGTLEAGPQKFAFQLRVLKEEGSDAPIAELDSFNEGIKGLPLEYSREGKKLTFNVAVTKAEFVGELNEDETKISGTWKQSGQKFPLEFERVPLEQTKNPQLERPQTPKAPYDFDESELTIKISDEVTISGTLATPRDVATPFPVVVTVTGSGPQDRDETLFGHKLFLVLTDALTKRGIAVFRYDERGVAKSTGTYMLANTRDFADDTSRILDHLAGLPQIDRQRMAIVGHSEGGIVASMVAARRNDLAAIVMLAGTSVPGRDIILDQSREIARAQGAPPAALDIQDKMLKKALAVVLGSEPTNAADPKTKPEQTNTAPDDEEQKKAGLFSSLMESIQNALDDPAQHQALVEKFDTPWMKYFLEYDPAESLKMTKTPMLALFGSKDLQVTPALNIPPLRAALEAAENPDFEIVVLEGLNHLFQNCETGSPLEYATITETIASAALDKVGRWLQSRLIGK